jgi:aminopeptidase N
MLEAWLESKFGPKYFFSMLHNYLESHSYHNAETKDLWQALSTPDEDVSKFMSTWTDQAGFPFVTVSAITDKSFITKQARFLFADLIHNFTQMDFLPVDFKPPSTEQCWYIPVSYSVYSNSSGDATKVAYGTADLASLGDVSIDFPKEVPAKSIVLLNYLQTGVYRSIVCQC